MSTKISILALFLAIVAIGVAAFDRPEQQSFEPSVSNAQLVALGERVDMLARAVEEMNARSATARIPDGRSSRNPDENAVAALGDAEPLPGSGETIKDIVDAAVEEKAREVVTKLETKANKKPSMDVFASTLELTDEQRWAAEQEVISAQAKIKGILETPTADGSNLMDELVEVYARSIAEPGKDVGWNKWLLRVAGTKIPGTDKTYAQQAEAVKASLKEAFRRDWSKEQYAGFEAWRMDPTEIQGIEGSPFEEVGQRIRDRAEQLGAELPEEDGE